MRALANPSRMFADRVPAGLESSREKLSDIGFLVKVYVIAVVADALMARPARDQVILRFVTSAQAYSRIRHRILTPPTTRIQSIGLAPVLDAVDALDSAFRN